MKQHALSLGLMALLGSATTSAITIDAADVQLRIDDLQNDRNAKLRLIEDLDGDGQPDLVTALGRIYALSSATSEVIWQSMESIAVTEVTVVQDRNGDGISDLVSNDFSDLILTSGADGTELMRVADPIEYFGLTQISDQNADGVPELAAREGLVSTDGGTFQVRIIDGASLMPLRVIADSSRRFFADSIGEIDDLNNDGVNDLLVTAGSPPGDPVTLPSIRIYAGGSFGFLGEFQINGSGGLSHSAEQVISPGDVDGDGISDILVAGRTQLDETFDSRTVVVDLYSGQTRDLLWRTILEPGLTLDPFAELSIGRIDGDAINDIAIPVVTESNSRFSELLVLSGQSGQILNRYGSENPALRLGQSSVLNDLDGDGLLDVTALTWSADDSQDTLGLIFRGRSAQSDINTAQLSGGWVDRFGNFPNQGVFLEFTESQVDGSALATLIWYGYQGNAQRFLVGGPIPVPEATSTLIFDLIAANGAQFGGDFDSNDVQRLNRGQAALHIGQCDQVDLHVSLNDAEQSSLSLEPFLASTFGLPCQLIDARSLQSANKTGIWWNQSRDGEGYFIDSVETGNGIYTFLTWFAYNEGNALWVAGGGFADEQNDQVILEAITARRDGSSVELMPFGTLTLDYDSCGSGNVSYQALINSVVGEQTGSVAISDDFTGPLIGVDCQN